MTPESFLDNDNVKAFLMAIRLGEGTIDAHGYRRIVGGELFDNFADHPRKRVWIARYGVWSTAAGAYQFIARTWDEMAERYKLPDFSPKSQDIAAIGLIIRRKALDAVLSGDVKKAIELCNKEWASLPGSPYGQRTEALERVLTVYKDYGGKLAKVETMPAFLFKDPAIEVVHEAPIERKDVEATPVVSKEKTEQKMSPFLIAAVPQLLKLIPDLMRVFGKGEVTERNAKAAEALVNAVTNITNATNAQDAIERITADPELLKRVRDQLEQEAWFEVTEAGSGGIEGARKAAADSDGVPFYYTGVFWITVTLMPLLYMTVYIVLISDGNTFSGELKAAVASSVVTGILGSVAGYWLGSKFNTRRI